VEDLYSKASVCLLKLNSILRVMNPPMGEQFKEEFNLFVDAFNDLFLFYETKKIFLNDDLRTKMDELLKDFKIGSVDVTFSRHPQISEGREKYFDKATATAARLQVIRADLEVRMIEFLEK